MFNIMFHGYCYYPDWVHPRRHGNLIYLGSGIPSIFYEIYSKDDMFLL